MTGLRELLRLRRQSDKVKWALAAFLLAGVLAVHLAGQLIQYLRAVGEPVEYVLVCGSTGAKLESELHALEELDGVVSVSRQREYAVTVGSKTLTVTEVSEQYMTACYGIAEPGGSFWLSVDAFWHLFGSGDSPAHSSCQDGERSFVGTFYRTGLPGELAVVKGNTRSLGDSAELRVMFGGGDVSGTRQGALEKLGFTVRDREQIMEQEYEGRLLTARLEYGLCALVMAMLAGRLLFREGKMEVRGKSDGTS